MCIYDKKPPQQQQRAALDHAPCRCLVCPSLTELASGSLCSTLVLLLTESTASPGHKDRDGLQKLRAG
uniref:Uncharacterized protein n=1 Tax=Knipowitschia caucasica TaxID=637954 RepID=A0AAV2ML04_KNICA